MKDETPNANGQRIPNGMLEDNYPRNMWWVAAYREEVTQKPIARWLLDTPVVLYRTEEERQRLHMIAAHIAGRRSQRGMYRARNWSVPIMVWSLTGQVTAPRRPPKQ